MGRTKIVWYEGAVYHITARGNRRNDIFRDEEDFQVYLMFLEEGLFHFSHYNYMLIAYCLMDNHIHLMLKAEKNPPGVLIARIHSRYTKYFNKKYSYIGHLFQDRYFAELIEDDTQMLEASRYIHLNPVKARMVECPIDYKWSSYSMLVGEKQDSLVDIGIILNYFKYERKFELYKDFVELKLKSLREQLQNEKSEEEEKIS